MTDTPVRSTPNDLPDPPAVPLPTDPLAEALQYLRMEGMFYCRSELSAPWGIDMPDMANSLWFHVVTSGEMWLVDRTGEEHRVAAGEVIVLPHGGGHRAFDDRSSPTPLVFDIPHDYISRQYAILRHGGGGAPATVICGVVRFDHPVARDLITMLPEFISIDRSIDPADRARLDAVLDMMAAETIRTRPGNEAVVTRLCDILVIQTIRSWIENDPRAMSGWLGALRDPAIGAAITLIHRNPERDWSVATLAAEVSMSRSAFSARFTELVGQSAMNYVTRWRMNLAIDLLRTDRLTVAAVADRLGYGSEAAFSRAFKRVTGEPPSRARQPLDPMV